MGSKNIGIFVDNYQKRIIMEENLKITNAHIIEFVDRYAIDARLLGHRIRICISDDSFLQITIPSLVVRNGSPEIKIPGILKKYKNDIGEWGWVKSYDNDRIDNLEKMDVWISAVLVECFSNENGNTPNSSIIQAEAKKVLHSLQIINPDAIQISSNQKRDDLCNVRVSVSISEKGESDSLIILPPAIFDVRKEKLSISDIKSAFHNAHNSISAPYEMLNNARINLSNDDTRATVLNCATAIEVALKRNLSSYLDDNNIPQPLEDYVLKQADGFAKLIKLLKEFGINLTGLPNVQESVINIRNRVIHGGYVPSNKESQVAYGKTREALRVLNVPMFEINA